MPKEPPRPAPYGAEVPALTPISPLKEAENDRCSEASMPYWRLFCHVVWATKARQPVLDDADARIINRSIRATLQSFNAIPHAVGVMPDHVHVVASISPNVALSEVVGRMKGASAHAINHQPNCPSARSFSWQAEYGVLSFGGKFVPVWLNTSRSRKSTMPPNGLGRRSKTWATAIS